MTADPFFHAIAIDEDICIGCSHCVKACPTEALRVWNGKATLDETKCVDCGDCYRVCPVKAIYVAEEKKQIISPNNWNVALVPAVFFGQFHYGKSRNSICDAISKAGFQQIVEVEESVEALSSEIEMYLEEHQGQKNISSYCPAVIRLIQTRYPELIPTIVHLKSPVEITAQAIWRDLQKEKAPMQVRIFYVTPCAAKVVAIQNQTKSENFHISGTINMNTFYNLINGILKRNEANPTHSCEDGLSPKSVGWSLRGGEGNHLPSTSLSIDGMQHCIEFLDNMDKENFREIDFLEMKACDQGCAGGILNPQNRFLCVESLKKRMKANEHQNKSYPDEFFQKSDFELPPIPNKSVLTLDKNPAISLKMMNKTQRLMCYLPGFDCGACGAPTCKSLAEDVAKGNAILSHCVFMQRQMEKHHSLSPEHAFNIIESIWGKDRLDKKCDKKGAINDY